MLAAYCRPINYSQILPLIISKIDSRIPLVE